MFLFFVTILGLIIGSFLNVVICRLHTNQPVVIGRSKCVFCHTDLKAADMIPLFSFLFLRGHCRHCGKKLSWQYPLVEFATAAIFAILAARFSFQLSWPLVSAWFFSSVFIVIGVYDFKHFLILDKIVFPSLLLAFVFAFFQGYFWSAVFGAAAASGFFFLQYFLSSGRWIGLGDVKLGLLLGAVTGFPGIVLVLFLAYFLGALFGLALIITGKKHFSSKLPFGSFLAFSAIINISYGQAIIAWYLQLARLI